MRKILALATIVKGAPIGEIGRHSWWRSRDIIVRLALFAPGSGGVQFPHLVPAEADCGGGQILVEMGDPRGAGNR
jgi:hypothetical protein